MLWLSVSATDSTLNTTVIKSIIGNFKNFEVDNMGNVFLISNSNQIKKLNNKFDSVGVFNDTRRFGNITSVDVNNALKSLVYYKDFSTILILDRFFNIKTKIDLRQKNIFKSSVICLSYDNNIWVYDEFENKIKKIDDDGTVLMETNDFRLIFEELFIPESISDSNGKLYLYNKSKGLLVLDYYGAYKNKFEIKDLNDVQISDNKLLGFSENKFVVYDLKMLHSNQFNLLLVDDNKNKIVFKNNLFYLLNNSGLQILKLN